MMMARTILRNGILARCPHRVGLTGQCSHCSQSHGVTPAAMSLSQVREGQVAAGFRTSESNVTGSGPARVSVSIGVSVSTRRRLFTQADLDINLNDSGSDAFETNDQSPFKVQDFFLLQCAVTLTKLRLKHWSNVTTP